MERMRISKGTKWAEVLPIYFPGNLKVDYWDVQRKKERKVEKNDGVFFGEMKNGVILEVE
jgi:hypothetical protein